MISKFNTLGLTTTPCISILDHLTNRTHIVQNSVEMYADETTIIDGFQGFQTSKMFPCQIPETEEQ